jgi:hypothetical protein
MKFAALLLGSAIFTTNCFADECSRTPVRTVVKKILPADQEACERECRLMAKLHKMHVSKTPRGIRFEGCGISKRAIVPTCRPKNTKLVCTGDCTINVRGWFYRARVWR